MYEALLIAKKPLEVPGSGSKTDIITGVDVVYDNTNLSYLKNRELNKIHCSIAMRGTAVVIPNDDIALKIAVIFKQIDQVMKNPLEISVGNLLLNIKTLHSIVNNPLMVCKEEVIKGLCLPNMAAYFTGDLDVSSINKLLLLALLQKNNDNFDIQQFARVVVSLEAYHYVRGKQIENKKEKLIEIFDVKMTYERRRMCNSPGESEPKELKPYYDDYDETNVVTKTNMFFPNYGQIMNFIKFLHAWITLPVTNNYNSVSIETLLSGIKKYQSMEPTEVFGIDYGVELFVTANVIQAINFPELKYRVDTEKRVVLLPELKTYFDLVNYFKSVVRNEYVDDYDNQLVHKKQIEKEQATQIEINRLIEETDLDVFIGYLNEYIGNRNDAKYALLVIEMLKQNHDCIPYLRDKIWIMALCVKPYEEEVVWGRGNVCPKLEMIDFEKMWNMDTTSNITWTEFEKAQHTLAWNNCHMYRDGIANRHGHANICPYGLALKEYVPEGYWKAKIYNMSHRDRPMGPDDV